MSPMPLEYAMAYRVSASGLRERCDRPTEVRERADRLRRWTSSPELCQNCHTRQAMTLITGVPFCGACRANRLARFVEATTQFQSRATPNDPPADGAQMLRGYAVRFNEPSVDMGFVEYIRPSAAARTFNEGIDTVALWSHNPDLTIGRTSAGTLRSRTTSRGIQVEIDPPRWGQSYLESVARRDVQGMSFAFETVEDAWHIEEGEPVREILDMRVFEYSGVVFPAYPTTSLEAVKGAGRSAWLREQESAERLRIAAS